MTRHEQRCSNANRSLFEITQDMPEEIKLARLGLFKENAIVNKKHLETTNNEETNKSNNQYNFRDYDQDQTFFITVSKQKFLAENHPAVIIDTIVEKLDLTRACPILARFIYSKSYVFEKISLLE